MDNNISKYFITLLTVALSGCSMGYVVNSDSVMFEYWDAGSKPYQKNTVVIDADPSSFNVLRDYYAKDKTYVFYRGKKVSEADPARFKVLEYSYAVDSKNVFYSGMKIKNADPKTFNVIKYTRAGYNLHYARDKFGCYLHTRKVPCEKFLED